MQNTGKLKRKMIRLYIWAKFVSRNLQTTKLCKGAAYAK
jgi:hypothetical protein